MNETLFMILKYVFAILSLIVFRYVIPYVKEKLESTKYIKVVTFIEDSILAMESIITEPAKGEEKKKKALVAIHTYLNKNGIKISEDQLEILFQAVFTNLDGTKINIK